MTERKPRISLYRGIQTEGYGNVLPMQAAFEGLGFETIHCNYPRRNFITARWTTARDGRWVINQYRFREGDVLIGHSRGTLVVRWVHNFLAKEMGIKTRCYLFNGAIEPDANFEHPELVTNFHSPEDWVVRILATIQLAHPFGDGGAIGLTQPGIKNVKIKGDHDDVFEKRLPFFVNRIVSDIS